MPQENISYINRTRLKTVSVCVCSSVLWTNWYKLTGNSVTSCLVWPSAQGLLSHLGCKCYCASRFAG